MSTISLINPWTSLPPVPPYALAADEPYVARYNARASSAKQYDLTLLPEPYFGAPSAPVLPLALNPGWSPNDTGVHAQGWFAEQSRQSLAHALRPCPFLHLQPGSSTPGSEWWQRIAGPLIRDAGFEAVAKCLMCVQFFPYHSKEFGSASLAVPSQQYSFALVRIALRRGAEVVIMRSWRLWSAALTELRAYPRIHFVRNPRNPSLSSKNLASGYRAVLARVEAGA